MPSRKVFLVHYSVQKDKNGAVFAEEKVENSHSPSLPTRGGEGGKGQGGPCSNVKECPLLKILYGPQKYME